MGGVAFIELAKEEDVKTVREKDGENFTAGGKTRKISIADYEERRPKQKRKPKEKQKKSNTKVDDDTKTKPTYEGGRCKDCERKRWRKLYCWRKNQKNFY